MVKNYDEVYALLRTSQANGIAVILAVSKDRNILIDDVVSFSEEQKKELKEKGKVLIGDNLYSISKTYNISYEDCYE